MLQSATAESVKGDFSSGSVILRESRYRLRAAGNQYFITESFLTGTEREHRVEYTLGNRRIQHYLTTIENGRIIILPPTWDIQRRQWFHNMDIVRPDEDHQGRIQQWNKNCVGCHVSQQENTYEPATGVYTTRWQDFGTSCERCHGPGAAHVQQYARAEGRGSARERLIVRPTRLDPETSSMICAQCHSARNVLSPGFMAGENYYDYFMPLFEYGPRRAEDASYWSDGRPRRFSNDAVGLWQSDCFTRGGATCTSCHFDPHEPDIERNRQLVPSNNTLCTSCHRDIGSELTAHTRHLPDSAGSSCVECHMPMTVVGVKSTMRDHTMSLPAPENTVAFGIPNACTECHSDRGAPWAVEVLGQWWPRGSRVKLVARAEAFTGARAKRPESLEQLLSIAGDDRYGPLVQANAVGHLRNYADARALATLLTAAGAEHVAIRSVAVSSLGQMDSDAARTALLAALDDRRRAVRLTALASLVNVGLGGVTFTLEDERRFRRAASEFEAQASLHRDDADFQHDLGSVRLLTGDVDLAASALQIALRLEPDRPSTTFLLALARLGQERFDDARALLEQVPRSDPYYFSAQERLKTLGLRR